MTVRIAFLTTVLPSGRRTGGEVASHAIVDALRRAGHTVTVVGYLRPGDAAAPGEVAVAERTIESDRAGWFERIWWLAAALAGRLPVSAAKYRGAAYRRAARAAAAAAEVVVLDHAQSGWCPPAGGPGAPLVLVAHNVEADVYGDLEQGASGVRRAVLRRETKRAAALERRLLARADEVWTFTDDDRARLAPHVTTARMLPMPAATALPGEPRRPTMDVGVLGTWSWEPNAVGLRWFLDEVVPLLATRDVHVAGTGAPWAARNGVSYHGVVPDAAAFLDTARVVAIPSTAGRGVQIKTLDALGLGAWVVATPTALRGLDVAPPVARVADDPVAFAAAIDDLLASAATASRCTAALEWSAPRPARLDAALAAALDDLLRPSRP